MNRLLRIIVVIPAIIFVMTGIGYILDPAEHCGAIWYAFVRGFGPKFSDWYLGGILLYGRILCITGHNDWQALLVLPRSHVDRPYRNIQSNRLARS